MQTDTVSKQIQELEAIKAQKRFWSWGISLALLILVIVCLVTLRNAAFGLTQEGETRTVFQKDLSDRFQKNAVPAIQNYGVTAVREIDYAGAAKKLNARTPELVKASMDQLKTLSDDLTKRGNKVFDQTFAASLKNHDKKIRAMFPEANEEQVSSVMTNLTKEAQEQVADVNDTLLGPHKKSLDNIVTDLTLIQTSEAADIKGETPSWEMGLLIFDIAREDLKSLQPKADANTTGKNAPPKSGKEKK